ncbi:MAG: type II secretion system F family protein [Candidatus Omnitrophica bacterium]|nr:type II secretion system F family protein [Candidatus Omnitrophota bacterium]
MPSYHYLARDERGNAVSGMMASPNPEALAEQLKRMGYLVTRTQEVRQTPSLGSFLGRWQGVRYEDLVLFNVQLAKLIQVGIPLVASIKTLEAQTEHRRLREAIGRVAESVEGGRAFSEALAQHPHVFSHLFINMVRAGEVSGKLDEILGRLAVFQQHQAELREHLKTALTYPALLLALGIGIMTFLVMGVIPKFMVIFLDAGVPLPLPTLILYRLSTWLRGFWLGMLVGLGLLGIAIRALLRTPRGRRSFDGWTLSLPVIGSLVRKVALSRFARTLETLLSSGVPILESLAIAQQTAGNVVIADVVRSIHTSVRQGGSLAEPLKASREFPPMAIQMIAVGESSGTLDHMLKELADHYDQLVAHGLKRAIAFVEPLFLIIMGGMVAFIMASILLPMFRLVNVIH